MNKHIALLKAELTQKGGLEKSTLRIAEGFRAKGAKVSLLTAPPSLIRFPRFLHLEQYDRFTRAWIEEHKPDLIFGLERNRIQTHLRAGNGVHAAYLQARGFWKKALASISPFHKKILELERAAFSYTGLKKIFVNSYMVKQEILHYYNVDPLKIVVIHNGVEWEEMKHSFAEWPEQKTLFLQKQSLQSSCPHFLFIGNGYARKGLKQLLDSLFLLKTREFHLSVVGKEKRMSWYRRYVERLNLSKQVTFFGPQAEISKFYQLADILIIPSLYDPFANITVEALAMGLFVISSKSNGGHEILNASNGCVIPDLFDPHSFSQLLSSLLDFRKTESSSLLIRESVRHLDFSFQMRSLIESCLGTS